ncbi:MAG: hypothetical protein GF384_01045 [Elusimicrobia bacterium]|nr:hypothetical protein [Elusimicrobiota bacterium]
MQQQMRSMLIIMISLILHGGVLLHAETATEVSQYGITWTFDKEYEVGQFITGDWWVIPDNLSETVMVINVDPAQSLYSGLNQEWLGKLLNGSMINPQAGYVSQGFDGRANGYDELLTVNFPVILKPNDALISSISDEEPYSWQYLETAAVLTVLKEIPPGDAFRPGYVDPNKKIYTLDQVHMDILPSLTAPSSAPEMSAIIAQFTRPWLDFKSGWSGHRIFPRMNMSNYGELICLDVGKAALLVLCDPKDIGNKHPLIRGLIQVGIDLYHIAANGGIWEADGGCSSGRKFPILFAGLMLNDNEMLNIGRKKSTKTSWRFGEDEQTFYATSGTISDGAIDGLSTLERDPMSEAVAFGTAQGGSEISVIIDTNHPKIGGKLHSGNLLDQWIEITDGTGAGQIVLTGYQNDDWNEQTYELYLRDGYAFDPAPDQTSKYKVLGFRDVDVGKPFYSIRHWQYPQYNNRSMRDGYRGNTVPSWVGEVLAARALYLEESWNHDALFGYIDEFMTNEPIDSPVRTRVNQFYEDMWDMYREHLPDPPDPDPQDPNDPQDPQDPEPDPEQEQPELLPKEVIPDRWDLKTYNNIINVSQSDQALIQIDVKEDSPVRVIVYNSQSQEVLTLMDEPKTAGIHRIYWDGTDDKGNKVGSGIYLIHLKIGDYTEVKKIAVIK